jgi:hypothetical protein
VEPSTDHNDRGVRAAHRVLADVFQVLAEHRDHVVLIGGWVPYLRYGPEHLGSFDVDLLLDTKSNGESSFGAVRRLLEDHGYRPHHRIPFSFVKDVEVDDAGPIPVRVDFLVPEYDGSPLDDRFSTVQDITAIKARGSDLAFRLSSLLPVERTMPDGDPEMVQVRVSEVEASIVMKGIALGNRSKAKDAYDIYFCLTHHRGGPIAVAGLLEPLRNHELVREALQRIRTKFRNARDVGPASVAAFLEVTEPDERAAMMRDAFEQVNAFLEALGR